MKKILFFLILMISITPMLAETIVIDSVYGETELVVPKDYDMLRGYYIDQAKLYLKQRKNYYDLKEQYDSLRKEFDELDKAYTELDTEYADYRKNSVIKEDYKNYIGAGPNIDIIGLTPVVGGTINYTGVIFEDFYFGSSVSYPFQVQAYFGVKF